MPHPAEAFALRPHGGLHDRVAPTEISPFELAGTQHTVVAKGSGDTAKGYKVLTRTAAPRLALRFGKEYDGVSRLGPYLLVPTLSKLISAALPRNWTIEFGYRPEMENLVLGSGGTTVLAGLAKWGPRTTGNGTIHVLGTINGDVTVRVPGVSSVTSSGGEPHQKRWVSIVSDDTANLVRVYMDGSQIGTIAGDILPPSDAFILGICPTTEGGNTVDHAFNFAIEEFRAFNTNVGATEIAKWAGRKLHADVQEGTDNNQHVNAANLVSLIRMDEAGERFCRDAKRPHLPAVFGPTGGVVVDSSSPEGESGETGVALACDGLWSFLQADLTSREFATEWQANWNVGGPAATDTDVGFEVGFTLLETRLGILMEGIKANFGSPPAGGSLRVRIELVAGPVLRVSIVNGATTITATGATTVTTGERHVVGLRKIRAGTLAVFLDGASDGSVANTTGGVAGVAPDYLRVGAGFATNTKDADVASPLPVLVDTVRIYTRAPTTAQLAQYGRAWKEEEWEEPGRPRVASFVNGSATVTAQTNWQNLLAAGQGLLVRLEQTFTKSGEQTRSETPVGLGVTSVVAAATATLATAWTGRTGTSLRWAVPHLLGYARPQTLDLDFGSAPPSTTTSSLTEVTGWEKTALPVRWFVGTAPGARVFASPDAAQPKWAIGFVREDRDNPGTGMRFFRSPSTERSAWLAFGGFGAAEFDDRRRLVDGIRYMHFRHPQDGVIVTGVVNSTTFSIEAHVILDLIDGLRPLLTIAGARFGILNGRMDMADGVTAIAGSKTLPRGRRIHLKWGGDWTGTIRMWQDGQEVGNDGGAMVFPGAHSTFRIGRRSTTGRGTETFGGLIEKVKLTTSAPSAGDFVPPTTLTNSGASRFVDCGLGEEFALAETVADPDTLAEVTSPPLLEVSPRIGPSKRTPRPSEATIFDTAVYTTSVGPPERWNGTTAGRAGIFPPLNKPALSLSRSPWFDTEIPDNTLFNTVGTGASTGGSLRFYGINWISYAVSNPPEGIFPDDATTAAEFKLPLVAFGKKPSGAANSGVAIMVDGWFKIDTNAPRERMPLVLRRANETDEGNFSVWLDPTGTVDWRILFAFFDSKDRAVRSFSHSTQLFQANEWVYGLVVYRFGSGVTTGAATSNIWIAQGAGASQAIQATLVTVNGTLGADDSPALPEFDGALEIGGGSYLLSRSKPGGFVGKLKEIRVSSIRRGGTNVTFAGSPQNPPIAPLDNNVDQDNAILTGPGDMRPRVVFGNDEGRGYRVKNSLHFREATTGGQDLKYQPDNRAEPMPHADLLSQNGPPHIAGDIQVVTTFFDPVFAQESNPSPIETIETQATTGQEDAYAITELIVGALPVSAERPFERRVYRTTPGGGTFFLDEEVKDGTSGEVRLLRSNASLAGRQALSLENAQAPNCRTLAATESRVAYGGLIDEGPGLVAWSNAFQPGSVPATKRQGVGSPLGGDVTALWAWGGRLLVFKEDSAQIGTFGDDSSLSLAPLEEPYGAAGPMAIAGADSLLAYATRKGIYAFTGNRQVYAGLRIEGSFGLTGDASETVAVYDPGQTVWLLFARGASSTYANTVVRMDASEGQMLSLGGRSVLVARGITVSTGWPIESAGLGVGIDGKFRLLGMTAMGSVVALETGTIAGNGAFDPTSALTWSASTTPVTQAQNAVTVTGGSFPTVGDGLRGAAGLIQRVTAGVTSFLPIVVWRASGTTIEYDGSAGVGGDIYLIGSYEKQLTWGVSALGAETMAKEMDYAMVHSTPGGISGDTTVECDVDSANSFQILAAAPQVTTPANTSKPWQLLVGHRLQHGVYFQFRVRAIHGAFSIRAIIPRFALVEPRP
jgi:hypothetical protein